MPCRLEDHRLKIVVVSFCPGAGLRCARHTDEKDKPVSWGSCSLWPPDAEQVHTAHNGADKVNVEDGVYVDQVKDDGNRQEAEATDASHDERLHPA